MGYENTLHLVGSMRNWTPAISQIYVSKSAWGYLLNNNTFSHV